MTQVAQNLSTASTANAITVSGERLRRRRGADHGHVDRYADLRSLSRRHQLLYHFSHCYWRHGRAGDHDDGQRPVAGRRRGLLAFPRALFRHGHGYGGRIHPATLGPAAVGIDLPLPAGTNQIGGVNIFADQRPDPAMNTGAAGADTLRVVTANNSPVNNAQIGGVNVLVDNGGFTDGTSPLFRRAISSTKPPVRRSRRTTSARRAWTTSARWWA